MRSLIARRTPLANTFLGSLTGGSATLSIGLMAGNVVAQAYQMAMSRLLSPGDYGILVTLTATSYVLAVVMRTFQAWIIKTVADDGGSTVGHLRVVFIAAVRTYVPLGAAAALVLWLASEWIAEFLQLDDTGPVLMIAVYAFSAVLMPIGCGMVMGLERLRAASVAIVSDPLARIFSGTVLIVTGFGVSGALLGYSVGNCVAFGVAMVAVWSLLARPSVGAPRIGTVGSLDRYTLLGLAINTSLMIMGNVDQIAVKHYFPDEVAGNYAVAFLLGRIIATSTMSLSWVIFTRSATMTADDTQRPVLLARWLLIIGGIAVTVTIGYMLLPNLAVYIMGGSQYRTAGDYVGLAGMEMTLFSLIYVQAYYLISVRKMGVIYPLCLAAALEMALIALYHSSVQEILFDLIFAMAALLVAVSILAWRELLPMRRAQGS